MCMVCESLGQQPKVITNSIGMELVLIPKGKFMMGTPNAIIGPELEETPHEVTITRDYYLGVYEVTQRQFQLVMGRNPSEFQGAIVDHLNEDLPVDSVSWTDAIEFCSKLSGFEEEKKSGRAYRLPTEAEWEYACRAGTTSVYSFGDEKGLLSEYAWFDKFGNNRTHTVGLKEPNPWGLYDMHGNVWEWCWDWDWEYPNESVIDPTGPDSGDVHILRGGGWHDDPYRCRSAGCRGRPNGVRRDLRGFRVAIGFPIPVKNQPSLDVQPSKIESSQQTLSTNSIGMQFALRPKGSFLMGSPTGEEGRNDDEVQHEVTITNDFHLGAYEVTQSQYKKIMGNNPSQFQGKKAEFNEDLPVESVSWEDAVGFCNKLTQLEQNNLFGRSYRLPTEAEWEYACRAGTASTYSFGSDKVLLLEHAWYDENSTDRIHTVGLKEPNPWGLYDMYGNVWEWCSDYGWAYANTAVKDPAGPAYGDTHVLRGGSYRKNFRAIRSAGVRGNLGRISLDSCGFRVVLGFPVTPTDLGSTESTISVNQPIQADQLINSTGMRFALIPRGTFMMGSPEVELERSEDEALHEVTISRDYYIGLYEVTQDQYLKVTGKNSSHFQGVKVHGRSKDHPVESVLWEEAVEFCKQLSELPEEKMAGRVYRLPTEAEWEYACRAGTKKAFSFDEKGDLLASYRWYHRHGWFELNSSSQTHCVGQKQPNRWGLYDMHGNVSEWCSDRYGEYPEGPLVDPNGPDQGRRRVARGGSYLLGFNDLCRSASRSGFEPTYQSAHLGFRVAMDIRPE